MRDRVRFASPRATEPCLQKVAAPESAPFGGCGRPFISPGNFDGLEPTPVAQYDAEFLFGAAEDSLKQIPFTCAAPYPVRRHAARPAAAKVSLCARTRTRRAVVVSDTVITNSTHGWHTVLQLPLSTRAGGNSDKDRTSVQLCCTTVLPVQHVFVLGEHDLVCGGATRRHTCL